MQVIATAVLRNLDKEFCFRLENAKYRRSFADQKYEEFLEDLESVRSRILAEINVGMTTSAFFDRMKRHIVLDDDVIESMGLLANWLAEDDKEWQENEERRKLHEGENDLETCKPVTRDAAE